MPQHGRLKLVDFRDQEPWGAYASKLAPITPFQLSECIANASTLPNINIQNNCSQYLNETLKLEKVDSLPLGDTVFAPPLAYCANQIELHGSRDVHRRQRACFLITDGINTDMKKSASKQTALNFATGIALVKMTVTCQY